LRDGESVEKGCTLVGRKVSQRLWNQAYRKPRPPVPILWGGGVGANKSGEGWEEILKMGVGRLRIEGGGRSFEKTELRSQE